MKRYEYKNIVSTEGELLEDSDKMAYDGWELVTVIPKTNFLFAMYKREVVKDVSYLTNDEKIYYFLCNGGTYDKKSDTYSLGEINGLSKENVIEMYDVVLGINK